MIPIFFRLRAANSARLFETLGEGRSGPNFVEGQKYCARVLTIPQECGILILA
jgi:hypothetical protein